MSRIGKKPIELPAKVKINFAADGAVMVEGPKGKLQYTLPKQIRGAVSNSQVTFERSGDDRRARALHGLARALISNMVQGVNEGFSKDLEIQGVGFKAALQGKVLKLNLGYSHDILFPIPEGIKITVNDAIKIRVEGIDRQLVGQVAANIRAYYPPEPYKGKGVRYVGEQIIRKEGKTVQ
ncbi:MAG: 50S ribosomal protein L6 [Chthoniobacteraceae bacterium]